MLAFALRRFLRNWRVFVPVLLCLGVSSAVFASANISTNVSLQILLQEAVREVPVDMTYELDSYSLEALPNSSLVYQQRQNVESAPYVQRAEAVLRQWELQESYGQLASFVTSGIQSNSTIYEELTFLAGATQLGVNESLLVTGLSQIKYFPIGSNYTLHFHAGYPDYQSLFNVTLKVVGHVDATDHTKQQLAGLYSSSDFESEYILNCFIVDLEKTFLPLLDFAATLDVEWTNLVPIIHIQIDREALIDPSNVWASSYKVLDVGFQIQSQLPLFLYIDNWLAYRLYEVSAQVEETRILLLRVSIPLFFVAFYMGITLSDVTFSLRKREIGLLLTKGFTPTGITGVILFESGLMGLLAGVLGLGLAIFIVSAFLARDILTLLNPVFFGIDTIFFTLAFSLTLALVYAYFSTRRALKLPITHALHEYSTEMETTRYRKGLAWTCFLLGGYKLLIWMLGINLLEVSAELMFSNFLLSALIGFWVLFDSFIGGLAPLLFFYGFTMILIRGSPRFYGYIERAIHRIFGNLGEIAAHTIRRQSKQNAAIICLSALLIGYSILATGVLASNQDLVIRQVYADTGADISVRVYPENVSDLIPIIRKIQGVRATTAEYSFLITTVLGNSWARAINVSEWVTMGFFESEWFPVIPFQYALSSLAADNWSIILERKIAVELQLQEGSSVGVQFTPNGTRHTLSVVGFFGPEPELYTDYWGSYWRAEETWSYVSLDLVAGLNPDNWLTAYVLIALEDWEANSAVVEALSKLDGVIDIESAIDILAAYDTDVCLNIPGNMMQLGVVSALVLTSVGTLVVVYLRMFERRRSIALVRVRGGSYGQVVVILAAESLMLMAFSILVGLITGFITLYGTVKSIKEVFIPVLLVRQFLPVAYIIPLLVQIGAIIGLLLLATTIPFFISARWQLHNIFIFD